MYSIGSRPLLRATEAGVLTIGPRGKRGAAGDYIGKALWTHVHQHPAHARTFELEHPMGVTGGDELIRLGVVEWKVVDVDLEAAVLLEESKARGDDVEGLQAKEIDLQQADLADRLHVVLRHHRFATGAKLQRRVANQRLGSDHHACRVNAHVA